jgi:hypothetical protein
MSIEALDTRDADKKKTAGTPIPAVKTIPLSKNHYTTNSSRLAREN